MNNIFSMHVLQLEQKKGKEQKSSIFIETACS